VEELSALYVRNGQKMRDQIAEDLDRGFISEALAGKALALIRGDWRVVEG